MREKVICVLCGGSSSEREVSLNTGKAVYNALMENGYRKTVLYDVDFNNLAGILTQKPDVCFNALHGKVGEDGVLQEFLDNAGVRYTGSGAESCRLSFDKLASKEIFIKSGIPTPEYVIVEEGTDLSKMLPCVIKPAHEGSTVGITIADTAGKAAEGIKLALEKDSKVFAERYVKGKELTVSIFNDEIYPPIWIKPKNGFYDYAAKYTLGTTEYLFNLEMEHHKVRIVEQTAKKAYDVLGCEGVARVDIMHDGDTPYVLEVNTAPGMTSTSLLPKAAAQAGVSFIQLVQKMLYDAFGKTK